MWCFAVRRSAKAMVNTLVEYCNTAAGHHMDALRVSLSTFTARRAAQAMAIPLPSGATLPVGVDKLTEFAIITLIEHF